MLIWYYINFYVFVLVFLLKSIPAAMENLHSLKSLNLKPIHWITIPENVKKLESEGFDIILE